MATPQRLGYRQELVDPAAGQISREIFVNDEIYREELELVFARSRLFVGHESQIPNLGDFFRFGDGRGAGYPLPRPGGKNPGLPHFVPAPRHEGVPL